MNAIENLHPSARAGVVTSLSPVPRPTHSASSACGLCDASILCQIAGLGAGGLVSALDNHIGIRAVRAGEAIFRAGDVLRSLYIPRCGICKILRVDTEGRQQITAFKIAGECFGTDGIASGKHQTEGIALLDMQICVLPFLRAEAVADALPEVHRGMERLLSRETLDRDALLMVIANRNAEQRVAAFLLDMGARYGERTANPAVFPLCVSREDIGAYLGLTLETVSRVFSRLRQRRLIEWEGRVIRLLDMPQLSRL
ncbi:MULTISPECIES: helix-turn-helix domain-containing protein [unclassified Achromobacter]|uniref:helix-turn-helix domain-containing protein n=1 Tax=unclassified Achromobacter TaxID=2626865 RepID=UPI000B519562|nr:MULTISPECIES: helix-turn-helix domain-containing protein [unclassified Achromobacter]OWT74694.1 Crp/Fnr family transcriptional regulator [Achromobacter sp. HZ34]OWT79161.1 Crp/Fnr family transcriptional regulator [Achromobacter sp. HZ28]